MYCFFFYIKGSKLEFDLACINMRHVKQPRLAGYPEARPRCPKKIKLCISICILYQYTYVGTHFLGYPTKHKYNIILKRAFGMYLFLLTLKTLLQ